MTGGHSFLGLFDHGVIKMGGHSFLRHRSYSVQRCKWIPPNWFQFFDKQGSPGTYFAAKYGLLLKNLDRPTQMKKRRPCTHFTYKIWTSGLSKRVIEDSGNYSGTQVQQHTMYKLHSRWRFFFFFFWAQFSRRL